MEDGSPAQPDGDLSMEDGSPAQPDGDLSMEDGFPAEAGGEMSPPGGDSPGRQYPGELGEDIQAAQDALEQAGIALKTAGIALETAETDAALTDAEKSLAKARVSVIIAGQDLMDIGDIFEETPQAGTIAEAEKALNEANVAIVIATDSIFDSRIQLPEFEQPPGAESGQSGNGQSGNGELGGAGRSELDKELDASIAIFEGTILDARNGSTPPPTSAENVPGIAVLGGKEQGQGSGIFEENSDKRLESGIPDIIEQGRMPEGGELAKKETEGSRPPIPEGIPSPQGDDIVAQQLREAAVAETDPNLREKLWDEYKKYKTGL